MDAVLLPVDDESQSADESGSADESAVGTDAVVGDGADVPGSDIDGVTGQEEGCGVTDTGIAADLLGGWRELFNLDESTQISSEEDLIGMIRDQIASLGLLTADEVDRVVEGFQTAPSLVGGYRPLDYTGDVQLFVATQDKSDPRALAQAWRAFVTGEIPRGPRRHLPSRDGRPAVARGDRARAQPCTRCGRRRVPCRSVHGPLTPQYDPEKEKMDDQPFDDENGRFFVLVNHENQHSLWPTFADIPAGGPRFSVRTVARRPKYVEENWTDLRPKSLIDAMEADKAQADRTLRGRPGRHPPAGAFAFSTLGRQSLISVDAGSRAYRSAPEMGGRDNDSTT